MNVWPVRLFIPLGIRKVFNNTIFDFGDGFEQRGTKSHTRAVAHPDGMGGVDTAPGLWEFSISLIAIAHANDDLNQEVNKLWSFAIQQLASFEPFYFYNPLEAPTIDLTGVSTIGRYTVRFKDNIVSLEAFMMRLHRGSLVLIEVSD